MAYRHWGTGIPPQTRRYEKIPREAFRYDSPYGPAFNSRIDPAQLQFEMARQALNYNHRKEQEMSQRKVQVAGINESTHSAPRRRNSKASVKVQRYWEPEHLNAYTTSNRSESKHPNQSSTGSTFSIPVASGSHATPVGNIAAAAMAPRASSGARSEHTLSYADSVHPDAPMVASGIDGRQHTPGSTDTPGSIHEGAPKYRRNTASWRSESARASLASGRKRESAIEDDEDAVSKQAYKLPTGDPEHERHEAHLNSHRRTVTYSEPHKPDRRGNNVHSDAIHDDHVPPSVNSQSFPPETGQLPEFDAHSGLADTGGPMSLHHSYGRTSLSEQSRESPHMVARRFKQEREDRKRGTLKRQLRRLSKQSPKESRGADHSKTRLSGEVTPGDYLNVKNAGIRTRIKAFFRMG